MPVHRLRPTSPTGALASVSSPPPGGLSDRKAWPKAPLPNSDPVLSDRGYTKHPLTVLL